MQKVYQENYESFISVAVVRIGGTGGFDVVLLYVACECVYVYCEFIGREFFMAVRWVIVSAYIWSFTYRRFRG